MIENLSTTEILRWQLDAGVDETIGDKPVNHFQETPVVKPQPVAPKPGKTTRFELVHKNIKIGRAHV